MDTPPTAPPLWHGMLRRGGWTAGASFAIGLLSAAGQRTPLLDALGTVCITVGCWLFVDGGRLLVAALRARRVPDQSPGWPGWRWMALLIVVGAPAGFLFGQMLGGLLLGRSGLGMPTTPRGWLLIWLFSAGPAAAISHFFWSRTRLAMSEARARQAQLDAAQMQLRLLQSQLEPHMLFNTLANLRVLIGLDGARAQAMLDALIGFLRSTLAASRAASHPLSAEFARLRDYLALIQVRMGPRLAVSLELPDALAGVAVPPLLLQPLVENAVMHGLEPQVAGGRIAVGAAREGATLRLWVLDTGAGFVPGTPPRPGGGFGLSLVRERLATLHGNAARLDVGPAGDAEGGTLATVILPLPEDMR